MRNAHRGKHDKSSQPEDFFASLREQPASANGGPRRQTPEQQLAIFQMITGATVKH